MARPYAQLTDAHHDENFRLYESANPAQKRALALLHVGKPHAHLDPYLPQWRPRDVATCTGLLLSAVNAIKFRNSVDVRGVQLFAPISIYLAIVRKADKRGVSVTDYIAAQNEAARRRNARHKAPEQDYKTNFQNTLAVIDRLTRNSPKARAVFEKELAAIGVALPENAQQS